MGANGLARVEAPADLSRGAESATWRPREEEANYAPDELRPEPIPNRIIGDVHVRRAHVDQVDALHLDPHRPEVSSDAVHAVGRSREEVQGTRVMSLPCCKLLLPHLRVIDSCFR